MFNIDGFRIYYPEFSDEVKYPDKLILYHANFAEQSISAYYGAKRDYLVELMTAHLLTEATITSESIVSSGGGGGALAGGMVSSKAVGGVNVSYDFSLIKDTPHNSTKYGQKLDAEMANFRYGGIVVPTGESCGGSIITNGGGSVANCDCKDGEDGKSSYQIALDNGFVGTESEWLFSLVGYDGKSAYEVALDNGFIGTESEWLASLVGLDGTNGTNGVDGKSAYELALDNGFIGAESEWLASLVGKDGDNAVNPNFTIGTVASGLTPSVSISGAYPNLALDYVLVSGQDGQDGDDAVNPVFNIGTVVAGATPAVTLTGTYPNQSFNFTLQKGEQGEDGENGDDALNPVFAIGTVTQQTTPSVALSGTYPNLFLDFGLQKGDNAVNPNFAIGTVSSGVSPAVTLTGTYPNLTLNYVLQKGDKGDAGSDALQGVIMQDGTTSVDLSPIAKKLRIAGSTTTVDANGVAIVTVASGGGGFILQDGVTGADLGTATKLRVFGSTQTLSGGVANVVVPDSIKAYVGGSTPFYSGNSLQFEGSNITATTATDNRLFMDLSAKMLDLLTHKTQRWEWTGTSNIAINASLNLTGLPLTIATTAPNTLNFTKTATEFRADAVPYNRIIFVSIRLTGTIAGNNGDKAFSIQLRRPVGDILATRTFTKTTGNDLTSLEDGFMSFVNGTTDGFVTSGFRYFLLNTSSDAITLTGIQITIFKP
jgi:hypothetical protein